MAKKSKTKTGLTIVLLCIAAVFGFKYFTRSSTAGMSTATLAKMKGNVEAPLKITEFIDFQCPACAFGSQYLSRTIEKNPGLIRLQMKHYPLQMHKHGLLSAQYAECAAQQGKFWPFHDLLIQRQNNWKRLTDAQPAFDRMAREVELSAQELSACLIGGKPNKVIEKNMLEGRGLGIKSTPTYFVNGKMVVGQKSLALEINKYLEKRGD